jgi:hypothetical protein
MFAIGATDVTTLSILALADFPASVKRPELRVTVNKSLLKLSVVIEYAMAE